MRRAGVGLFAVVLVLVGCKGTNPKPADKEPHGLATSRPKPKNPDWLDPTAKLPGAGTGIPKADSWTDPKAPNFNVASEVKGVLAGRVLDPFGHGAKNVYIQIEPADAQPGDKNGAPLGINADAAGYFMAKGLRPSTAYNLTAKAETEGRSLVGIVQVKTPNPTVIVQLRDDLLPPGSLTPSGPPPTPRLPGSPAPVTGEPLPPPADLLPPMGVPVPGPTTPRPSDGAWSPGSGAANRSVPSSLDAPVGGTPAGPPPTPALPHDPSSPTSKPPKPENVADGPARPWTPPAVTIPGRPGSPFPPTVPPIPPPNSLSPPSGPSDPKKMSGVGHTVGNVALVDALERPWSLANRSGSVVLLDFMTTSCVPCKRAIPTLVDLQSRYGADGLQVVGVVCDDASRQERAARAAKYQRDNRLNYMLYVEPGAVAGSVRDHLGVESYPTVVLVDAAGNVLWRGHPTYPATHPAALDAAIRKALRK